MLHQSQIPNVLPDLRCIASRIGDDVPPECGHHGSMAINLEDAPAVPLWEKQVLKVAGFSNLIVYV